MGSGHVQGPSGNEVSLLPGGRHTEKRQGRSPLCAPTSGGGPGAYGMPVLQPMRICDAEGGPSSTACDGVVAQLGTGTAGTPSARFALACATAAVIAPHNETRC